MYYTGSFDRYLSKGRAHLESHGVHWYETNSKTLGQ
jgi:hypothetical protein